MRCEVCQGTGTICASKWEQPTPCYECNGFAVVSCCEGTERQLPSKRELYLVDRITDGSAHK